MTFSDLTLLNPPYDPTEHRNTIYIGRKHKVRCNLCTEEKMFSRTNAHIYPHRVCHPDVDSPGQCERDQTDIARPELMQDDGAAAMPPPHDRSSSYSLSSVPACDTAVNYVRTHPTGFGHGPAG